MAHEIVAGADEHHKGTVTILAGIAERFPFGHLYGMAFLSRIFVHRSHTLRCRHVGSAHQLPRWTHSDHYTVCDQVSSVWCARGGAYLFFLEFSCRSFTDVNGALQVMSYISRRTIENKSVLGNGGATRERKEAARLIWGRVFGGVGL